jgi:hypothetical protein
VIDFNFFMWIGLYVDVGSFLFLGCSTLHEDNKICLYETVMF